ncbi:MAG TPA: hypothetical protein VHR66_32970 [Gemmataceae bacterium]|jgi:hypothetical protein|nr:hypothetical protein [Gemmataceae bacterium]
MLEFGTGQVARVRFHPSALMNPQQAALLGYTAIAADREDLARMAVTKRILATAKEMVWDIAEAGEGPFIDKQFKRTARIFRESDLIDPSPAPWTCPIELEQGRLAPGDLVAIQAAVAHRDHWIVTRNEKTLYRPLSLTGRAIQLVSPAALLGAMMEAIPDVLQEAMDKHRTSMDITEEVYGEFLRSAGFGRLIPLLAAAG